MNSGDNTLYMGISECHHSPHLACNLNRCNSKREYLCLKCLPQYKMRCALVFHLVATIFGTVYSVQLCVIKLQQIALCAKHDTNNILDFIPPIAQNLMLIDLTGQPLKQLPDNAFRNLSSQRVISKITLRDCKISRVDAGALLNLHNLRQIDLSHNELTQIDSKLFSDTKRIEFINIGYNKIEVLPSGLFENLSQLETVYLDNNRIRQVEVYSFKHTPSLRFITFDANQIEFMNMSFKDEFENVAQLGLTDNPWKCDCDLGPFYEFAVKFNVLNLFELVCEKPARLQGKMWTDVSRDNFVCPSEDARSTRDSVMTSTEPRTTTEADGNVPVTVHSGTPLAIIAKQRS